MHRLFLNIGYELSEQQLRPFQIWSGNRLVLAQAQKRSKQRLWIPNVCNKERTSLCVAKVQVMRVETTVRFFGLVA